jgi:hypothetical protein
VQEEQRRPTTPVARTDGDLAGVDERKIEAFEHAAMNARNRLLPTRVR